MSEETKQAGTTGTAVTDTRSQLTLAIEKGLDPATISKLMDLQERWDANQAKKAYVAAMAAFKSECPPIIGKDKRVNYGQGKANFRHATIGHIIDIVTPHLSKNGLHVSWETKQDVGKVTVICHVRHEGGHCESTPLTGPYDESGGKNPIQTVGSSVTYLQRYTLVCALGLATADQDDADDRQHESTASSSGTPNSGAANLADRLAKQQRPSTPPPAPPASTDTPPAAPDNPAIGLVERVTSKQGKKANGTAFTKHGVQLGGNWYGTFNQTHAEFAEKAKEDGDRVAITWKEGQYGRDIEEIKVASEDAPSDTPADGNLPFEK